jgi:hypothetical protein
MPYVLESTFTEFKRPTWLITTIGEHLLRILDTEEEAEVYRTHWFNASVKCLDDECPQCSQNAQIRADKPGLKNYNGIKGYRPIQKRTVVNVLVKSTVKVCPNCGAESTALNKTFPSTCYKCNAPILDVEPIVLNDVRILMKGPETFNQIATLDATTLDENRDRIGIVNFDVKLHVVNKTQAPFIQIPENGDKTPLEELGELDKFDLDTIVPEVTHDEMVQLMRGIPLRDIYAQRRDEEDTSEPVEKVSNEVVKDRVSELFGE